MKKFLYTLMVVLLVISCKEDLELNSESGLSNETPTENEYLISVDSALANLNAFMTDTESYATRTVKFRTVSSITPIKFNSTLTRAVNENLECENLLYVANFEDEQGYAILAGDTRIEEKVIAVADDGQLSDVTVYTTVELVNAKRIIIFKLNDSNIEHDPGTIHNGDTNYNNLIKIITYEKP